LGLGGKRQAFWKLGGKDDKYGVEIDRENRVRIQTSQKHSMRDLALE
jgi:hypothetical protein